MDSTFLRRASTWARSATLAVVLLSLGVAAPAAHAAGSAPLLQGNRTKATVIGVVDGDTIKVRTGNQRYLITLYTVAAPGAGECYHQESTAALRRLLPAGSTIKFTKSLNTNEAGAYLADGVVGDGLRIDVAMVSGGFAQMYESMDQDDELARASSLAYAQERGMFGACTEWPLGDPSTS